MEFLVLAVVLGVVAVILALLSGHPVAWFRNELRLIRAETWEPSRERITGATLAEERAARLLYRQRALAKRMRKTGKHLFAGRRYKPALTAPIAAPLPSPPKAFSVVTPIRKQR